MLLNFFLFHEHIEKEKELDKSVCQDLWTIQGCKGIGELFEQRRIDMPDK